MAYKNDGTGRLHGRVAIVTGASSGMGRAIALGLAREGAYLVCGDLKAEAQQAGFEGDKHIPTHEVIAQNGGKAIYRKCDMSKTQEIVALVDAAVQEFGKLNILVNNAGLWLPLRDFVEETEEMWDRMMNINGKGTSTSMRLAIKQFLKQPVDASGSRGRIVNISSSAGFTPVAREATYAASKAAVCMLTRVAALDHAKDFINVNSISPGVVRTAMSSQNFRDADIIAKMRTGTPWPRLGEPDDVAKVAVFLCSDDAQWVTGVNMPVDGGFTIGIPL